MLYSNRLQYLRERTGLTQAQAGLLIKLDSGTYCHYEKEELIIPIKHLNTIANYFNVSLDYLFEFSNVRNYEARKNQVINKIAVGIKLKELRKELKLTQKKLAEILNTTQSVIAEYENGKNLIATPFLYTICKKYNISADYLLGKIDNPKYLNN